MTLDLDDTIVAIASAAGAGGRGILRLSGPNVSACLNGLFAGQPLEDRIPRPVAMEGSIHPSAALKPLPAALYLWPAGRSYTGQTVAELHTLAAPVLLECCLRSVIARGARLARPGEFTLRAFLAGRIDLTEAEAVLGVIDAAGPEGLAAALGQLAGGLSTPLGRLRDELLDLAADLEAGLDFGDEDIRFVTPEELRSRLSAATSTIGDLFERLSLRTAGPVLPRIVLLGEPNVGKSSLLNALAGRNLALVSAEPGTTRDYVSAEIEIAGGRCLVVDTAGSEPPPHETETSAAGGVAAAAQAAMRRQRDEAAVTVLCIEAGRPRSDWETSAWEGEEGRRIIAVTKADLAGGGALEGGVPPGAVVTSAVTGAGVDRLRDRLTEALVAGHSPAGEVVPATAVRCHEALGRSASALARARALAEAAAGEELVAAEVRAALEDLGRILGTVYSEDLLDRIFSRFCIGK